MTGFTHKALIAVFGVFAASAACAQTVDVKGATAGETAKTERGVTADGKHTTAGAGVSVKPASQSARQVPANVRTHIVPKPARKGNGMAPLNGDESGVAPRANVNNADQAGRSAESTAHKTVYDPNNQLGTSTRGTTIPAPGSEEAAAAPNSDTAAPADTSAAETPAQ